MHTYNHRKCSSSVKGFTLIELLIATSILILLTSLTVAVYSTTASADRIRSSARQVQSALSGARDRAIKAGRDTPGARRGLRFLVDSNDPTVVTSFVYVGNEDNWSDGQITIGRLGPDANGQATGTQVRIIRGWPKFTAAGTERTSWQTLFDQGLVANGSRIRIPKGPSGNWYTIKQLLSYPGAGPEMIELTSDYRQTPTIAKGSTPQIPDCYGITPQDTVAGTDVIAGVGGDDDAIGGPNNPEELGAPNSNDNTDINAFLANPPSDYEIELLPTVIAGQEPLRLSSGIAINLTNFDAKGKQLSQIPSGWFNEKPILRGSSPPAYNTDGNGNFNGWGTWTVVAPDPSAPDPSAPATKDICRQYSPHMDIMFAPNGGVQGPLSAFGMISFLLAEKQDITEGRNPGHLEAAPTLYSTLFTQTGYVATFQVNTFDGNGDSVADNPLSYVRNGSIAGR